jgi:hypothetical protein
VIPKEEMESNAKEFVQGINNSNIPNLGVIVVFFDTKHGSPVVAGNVTKERMAFILKEVGRALPSIDALTEGGILQ